MPSGWQAAPECKAIDEAVKAKRKTVVPELIKPLAVDD